MEIHFNTIQELGLSETLRIRYTELLASLKGKEEQIPLEALQEVFDREDSELLVFMEVDGQIAGMAQASFLCVPSNYTAYINHVVVDASLRGKGLGAYLMEELQRRAKERWPSLQKFTLTSSPAKGTQGFYTRLGYTMRTKEAGDETIVYVKKV
jgi:GNAT superfamily N-acetyltransferase